MPQNILITLNALKDNRGSEALIRGLVRICKEKNPDCHIVISSGAKGEIQTQIPYVNEMISRRNHTSRTVRIKAKILKKLTHDNNKVEFVFYKELMNAARKADIIFVIGADNYDASYKMHGLMMQVNTYILKSTKAPSIMYDCSLEENDITESLLRDIDRFSVITVRESETKKVFEPRFEKGKVRYYPDPAFVMIPEACQIPDGFEVGKMVGINLSNLIATGDYGAESQKLIDSYHNMIQYILDETDLKVIMIPHVMGNADLSMLSMLYQRYTDNNRVILLADESYNAAQLKYIISQLSYLVTARTHASIAAYSTCVPTLVLGYSVKSIGIAKDLFGTVDNYVISTKDLETSMELKEGFQWLLAHGDEIKERLQNIMPEYQKRALSTGELLDL